MIGYHYTSLSNWRKIKKEGIIPYIIEKPELMKHFGGPIRGVWTWANNLMGREHLGSVIFQMANSGEFQIVKLSYPYSYQDILRCGNREVVLRHNGTMKTITGQHNSEYSYHEETPARIITRRIPPSEIKLVGIYGITGMPIKEREV